ncbi:hypothetical protein G9A89_003769 [Geosiphon pyriformis]|nr:hypothetical protein G9A89_003769 [Geosiphon pyriformis]
MDSSAVSDICQSYDFSVICNNLLTTDAACFSVYMDKSLCGLGTIDMKSGAAIFFQDINLDLGVKVSGLVSSTLIELQAIALALDEKFLRAGDTAVSGNSRHFVCDVFQSVHHARWEVGLGSQVTLNSLCADINWLKFSMLPVAVYKYLYDRCYFSVVCLFCGDVEVSNHVFCCLFDVAGRVQLLDAYASVWKAHSGLSWSSLGVLQLLYTCVSNIAVGLALCKGFSVSVFRNPRVMTSKVVDFIYEFCLAFRENIWLVCAKHQAFMDKNGLISHDVKLLGIAEAFDVGFGFCNPCSFFSGIRNLVSVHIGV